MSALRLIAIVVLTLVAAPWMYGNDAEKLNTTESKGQPDSSASASPVPVKAEPNVALPLSESPSRGPQPQSGSHSQSRRSTHRADQSKIYTPKVEWFLGYSFWRAMPTSTGNRMGYLHGGSTSVAYNFNRYLGLVADFGAYDDNRLTLFNPSATRTVDSDGMAYTYMLGPRFSYRRHERFTPFVQALFGGASASSVTISGCSGSPSCKPLGSDNAFASMFGAGFDIQITRHIGLRPFEGDFLLTHFDNSSLIGRPEREWQKNARFSAGIVFRFGGNPAPVQDALLGASCSADREMVYAGSGDFVGIRADANNPGNLSLNYSWSASEGDVAGSGGEARWDSSGRRPGTYTIKVRVDDGRRGTADCAVDIQVKERPNRPPTISCSANRGTATVGEVVEITAVANDPDDDRLSFSWDANGQKMEGSGPSAEFQTAGLMPGSYTVVGHVDDSRAGTSDCRVSIDVQAAQLPAEAKELETRLVLHSIYFPTARPRPANPKGGLLESQQTILLSLASDFTRYLTFQPHAHLILEGHADLRGSAEYNQLLTERRVELARSFLIEHGVPAASIETRALGDGDNLNSGQVKQLVEQNPDLSNEERHRIEGNLQVIVWANNRRVDISLNTTGQNSVRQYPFNAKDSLTLLSPQNDESEKHARAAAKKSVKP